MTGMLVRAPQAEWRKSSVIAVDGGAHLASIVRILQQHMPHASEKIPDLGYSKMLEEGPFAGVNFPHISARHNALHVFRELLHSFLITHPHLDHLAAMAINTPALEYGREAKAIIALPAAIDAIKSHIFNDSIWPNLSDEEHGVGLVTYRRLVEGGNPRLGSGEARGYVSVCDGLATKCWSVSHGKCQRRNHSHSHQRGESGGWFANDYSFPTRRLSRISDDHGYFAAMAQQQAYNHAAAFASAQGMMPPGPLTPGGGMPPSSAIDKDYLFEPVTSSAFFIRNEVTGNEILIFGDVEPDSLSISPRNRVIWDDAAPKIANGTLKAIFIECSFDDATRDQDLYGHLCPRHLIAELRFLATCVMNHRERRKDGAIGPISPLPPPMKLKEPPSQLDLVKKRKRDLNNDQVILDPEPAPKGRPSDNANTAQYVGKRTSSRPGRRASHSTPTASPAQRPTTPSRNPRHVQFSASLSLTQSELESGVLPVAASGSWAPNGETTQGQPELTPIDKQEKLPAPLKGLNVHIIHVKDTMLDGPSAGQIILDQLRNHASAINLGCDFDVTDCGESIWI